MRIEKELMQPAGLDFASFVLQRRWQPTERFFALLLIRIDFFIRDHGWIERLGQIAAASFPNETTLIVEPTSRDHRFRNREFFTDFVNLSHWFSIDKCRECNRLEENEVVLNLDAWVELFRWR